MYVADENINITSWLSIRCIAVYQFKFISSRIFRMFSPSIHPMLIKLTNHLKWLLIISSLDKNLSAELLVNCNFHTKTDADADPAIADQKWNGRWFVFGEGEGKGRGQRSLRVLETVPGTGLEMTIKAVDLSQHCWAGTGDTSPHWPVQPLGVR